MLGNESVCDEAGVEEGISEFAIVGRIVLSSVIPTLVAVTQNPAPK